MGYLYTQLARFWEGLVVTAGAHLTVSVAGIFFFGFPVLISLSAYGFVILEKAGVAFYLAALIGVAMSGIIGILFAVLYQRLSNDSFAVFTVASILAFDALIKSWDSLTGGVLGISGIPRPSIASSLFALMILQGIIAMVILGVEYVLLRSPFGRSLQAHKESTTYLDATGRSARMTGSLVIIFASVLSGIMGVITIWRIQFLDPSFAGIPIFITIMTIAIIAVKPDIRWLVGATAIIIAIPELLRFFSLPPSILGNLRLLIYSVILIVLVRRLSASYTGEKRFV